MKKLRIILTSLFALAVFFALPSIASAQISPLIAELPRTGPIQPQVIAQNNTTVTELPRTGVPALAWAVAALVPIGARLLRKKKDPDFNPQDTWFERELNKHS